MNIMILISANATTDPTNAKTPSFKDVTKERIIPMINRRVPISCASKLPSMGIALCFMSITETL